MLEHRSSCWLELLGGLGVGVHGLAVSFYLMKPAESYLGYLQALSLQTCASLSVAAGAYFHVARGRGWGGALILVAGAYLALHLLWMIISSHRVLLFLGWLGLFLLLPGVMAVVTMGAWLRNRRVACRAGNQ